MSINLTWMLLGKTILGLAGVVRDHNGSWIMGFQGKFMADSSLIDELLAVKQSLKHLCITLLLLF